MTTRDETTARKKKKFLEAYRLKHGNISMAAKAASISRSSFHSWFRTDPEFKDACVEIVESVGDFVESKLLQKISSNDTISIIFYCKTKLKERGYIERQEQTGKDGKDLNPDGSNIVGRALELLRSVGSAKAGGISSTPDMVHSGSDESV